MLIFQDYVTTELKINNDSNLDRVTTLLTLNLVYELLACVQLLNHTNSNSIYYQLFM